MDIRPILSTLSRHKMAAALIVLEIALSCAIICNALFLIGQRLDRINTPSGIAEQELVRIQLTGIELSSDDANQAAVALTRTDLAALRNLPGVKGAIMINQVPFNTSSSNSWLRVNQEDTQAVLVATNYMADEALLDTLGVELVAGRNFRGEELIQYDFTAASMNMPTAIVTRDVAARLYPGVPVNEVVGKTFFSFSDTPTRIIGVVDRLVRPGHRNNVDYGYSVIYPVILPYTEGGNYLLRVAPERRAETLTAAVKALEANSSSRIILRQSTVQEMREKFYRQDRSMAGLLIGVCIALLVVTALGIVGLASFWVQQRTKQIGIRRALGATRRQILYYFQTENFLLASIGIVLGMLLAFSINQWLMGQYELPRLPLLYLPVGAVTLWLLGQLAVLGPALRAAAVPPAVATRGS